MKRNGSELFAMLAIFTFGQFVAYATMYEFVPVVITGIATAVFLILWQIGEEWGLLG